MANNPYVNKVQKADGTTIIDISDTTAIASDVLNSKYFYTASGQKIQGTATSVQFTATLTRGGSASKAYVMYNNVKYYTLGDVFNFTPGDTLHVYLDGAYSVFIYVNDEVVASRDGGGSLVSVEYDYTLPKMDISIKITAVNSMTRDIKIFTSPLLITKSITENGTYNASSDNADGYSSVVVNVSGGGGAPVLQTKSKTYTPTTSQQTESVTADSGYDGLDTVNVTVNAMPSGSATPASSISGSSATVSTGTNTLTLTKSVSNTPQVSAGYISSGTSGNTSVSLTASVTTKAAATITPGTTNQTISSGTYLTGTQTISGDANLVGSNIISGTSIFGVSGSVVIQKYYTGSSAPSSSLGNNGDIYFQS